MLDALINVEWRELFVPTHSIAEMMVRGTLMYLGLFLIFRFIVGRQSSAIGIADILVIVLIADAAQNAMAGEYTSITDGLLLVATIVFWAYALDWLGYRVPWIQQFVHPKPLLLIENGRTIPRNLRSELLTHEELMTQLRTQGVEDVSAVKRAYLEGNGALTVIKADGEPEPSDSRRP